MALLSELSGTTSPKQLAQLERNEWLKSDAVINENVYIGKTALKIILSNLISNAVKYTDVNGVINIGIVNDWLYIENSYGNNKISNMDKIFDVKFDLNKENSNGLGLYIVSNILNNYNIEYKALQDEEFFIFKIKIFS